MARTLIITNADFSVNKLDTVTFGNNPCTAISLSSSTASITAIGSTSTLTATVTPSDTTDTVVWGSSDTSVATVSGGVITAVGCGSATITATCGSFSDTCTVTVTHIATLTFDLNTYLSKDTNKDYLTGGALNNYALGYSSTGTLRASGSNGMETQHPVLIPNGANTISISSASFRPYGFWLSSTEHSTAQNDVALAYAIDDNFKYNSSITGSRTVTIPDRTSGTYEGVDSAVFVFSCTTTITQDLVNAITVTFSKTST